MLHGKIRNLEFQKWPGLIVTKTNNFAFARTGIKILLSCKVNEVKLIEYDQEIMTKYAFIKRKKK